MEQKSLTKYKDYPRCPRNSKIGFKTYKECLKFSREVESKQKLTRKKLGRHFSRNSNEKHAYKVCRSIYLCEYCGLYHFSSWRSKHS